MNKKFISSTLFFILIAVCNFSYAAFQHSCTHEISCSLNNEIFIGEKFNLSVLKSNEKLRLISNNEKFAITNAKKSEVAVVDKCCGGWNDNAPQRILIEKLSKKNLNKYKFFNSSRLDKFTTNQGVFLGITQSEFNKKMSLTPYKPIIQSNKRETVIRYHIEDPLLPLLVNNNMPTYIESYYFKDNILFKYEIGFELP